jgi:MFS family permease
METLSAPVAADTSFQPVGWSRFIAVWGSQTLSMSGQGLTSFALGVWVFLKTGSATQFALLEVASVLPGLLMLPFVGVLTDRLGPRRALLLADGGGLVTGLVLALVFAREAATPALLLLLLAVRNVATGTHWPAYTAATTALVAREHVPRAGGLMQVGYVGQQVIAPAIAGWLMGVVGVAGVILVDVASFVLAMVATATATFPPLPRPELVSWRRQLSEAYAAIRAKGLLRLAGYTVATYLPGGLVIALATPLVLSFAGPKTLGLVTSAMGTGMLFGSVFAARLVRNGGGLTRMLRYDAVLAGAMLGVGFVRTPVLVSVMGFLFLFGLAGLLAEEQALWQVRVPVEEQGRVFALRRLMTFASLPVSYALAGPLADRVFEPFVRSSLYLASPASHVFGTGPGRGMAMLLVCGGLFKASLVMFGHASRELQQLNAAA